MGSETAGRLGFPGGWNMVTLGGCFGWSYVADCGMAFLKMILSVYLACSSFPSLGLWDFAIGGDGKHSCPSDISIRVGGCRAC